ncbi:MAG: AcrR family transcriptional regulator [Paracoccaceae bacterium]|jgi:AcrR family transcriptional regulator
MAEADIRADRSVTGSTKERILHTAARLFSERGFDNVSLRDITTGADVNIAAVNYHFGSKVGLLTDVFDHYAAPVNAARLVLLDECDRKHGDGTPAVEDILWALLSPVFHAPASGDEGRYFRQMLGRMSSNSNPDVRRILFNTFDTVSGRFVDMMSRACPDLPKEELFWRLTCVYGAMMYAQADNGRIRTLAGDSFDSTNMDDALKYMIPFLTAGFTLPPGTKPGTN